MNTMNRILFELNVIAKFFMCSSFMLAVSALVLTLIYY